MAVVQSGKAEEGKGRLDRRADRRGGFSRWPVTLPLFATPGKPPR